MFQYRFFKLFFSFQCNLIFYFFFFLEPAEHLEDLKTLTLTKRDDADLTDKLWNVLKKVESFAQLSEAWKHLFQIFRKDDIKPYVSMI